MTPSEKFHGIQKTEISMGLRSDDDLQEALEDYLVPFEAHMNAEI